ncbi:MULTISPECIES: DUF3098 domain-containing protein [unclassified Saccharicrinis]|uniref:DUF3098 domain-containing protein n=1 Tax=unclassified Saccharicrinis TaxID=2646859 RepID=UPI003D327793
MSSNKQEKKFEFALSRENYVLMAIGFAIVILGFVLMIGGRSEDPNVFNEEIYGFQRITLAPMLVLAGFAFEIYAIMKKPKKNE